MERGPRLKKRGSAKPGKIERDEMRSDLRGKKGRVTRDLIDERALTNALFEV